MWWILLDLSPNLNNYKHMINVVPSIFSFSFPLGLFWRGYKTFYHFIPKLVQFNHSVMSDSVTPRTAARQDFLSQSLLKLMSIESVIPSNHLILCRPLLLLPSTFLSIRVFPMSQFFTSGSQSIGVSASASVLPLDIQDWFPLGWTGWISLLSKGLSRVFSNTTVQKHHFFDAQLSL